MQDLTTGSITRHLLKTTSFMLVAMIFQTLYFLVDLYWVGSLGKESVAGVGAAGNLTFIVLAVSQMLGVGATTLISHATGRSDRDQARLVFTQGQVLAIVVGIIFTVVTMVLRVPYSIVQTADDASAGQAAAYLLWFLPAMGLQFPMAVMGAALRGTGNFKPGMIVQTVTVVINMIVAPILIFGWGIGSPMGVAGAAIATLLAVVVGTVWLGTYFLPKDSYLRFEPAQWRPRFALWWRMLSIGLPAGGEFALMAVYLFIVYAITRPFGAAAQAGFGIGMRIIQAGFMPIVALAFAVAPVAGQNFGALKPERVKDTFKAALLMSVTLTIALALLCHIAPAAMVRIFSHDPDVVAVGEEYLRIASWNFTASAIAFVGSSMFQAMGNTLPPLAASFIRLLIIAIPGFALSRMPGFELRWLWYLAVAAVTLQALINLWLLRREFRMRLAPIYVTAAVAMMVSLCAPATSSAAPAAYVRYFAEGSTGFFETTVGLLNPSPTETAHITLTLLVESGGTTTHDVTLGPRERRTVSINEVLGISAAVSIIVESDAPIAADRWMTWGSAGIGASLDNGTPAPGTAWYFAEGATGPFLLYYLLQNPGTEQANVTVRYLIEGAPPVVTTRVLAPRSRTTVFVNDDDPALIATSLGAVVTSDVPIFAERAMYVNAGGTLGGGSVSAASSQAVTDWYFGEGSTGPFFHTFLSLLNPATTPATATVTYHMSDGSTASKAYEAPAEGRTTVYFNGEAADDPALASLATGPVWFTVSSTEPIVAERAMWWAADWPWYEGHAALGSTTSGAAWAVPEGRHGGAAFDQTYVLIGNTTSAASQVRLTLIPDAGVNAGAGPGVAVTRDVAIGATERLTLNIGDLFALTGADARFSVIVESLGTPATPLAVDYARYRSVNGLPFSGGGATPAIPVSAPAPIVRNLPPVFTAGPDVTVLEDAGAQTIVNWATAIGPGADDEAAQTVAFTVTANTNAALFSVAPAISPTGTLTFTPADDANGTAMITLVLQDNGGTDNGGVDTSTPRNFTITVDAVNDEPIVTAAGVRSFTEQAPATLVDPAIAVTDIDDTTLTGATVQITGNYVNGEDALSFVNTPAITGVFDAASGLLTLTGTDTIASYQAALRAVRYQNLSGTPNTSTRLVTWIVTDGAASSAAGLSTINVLAVNDAPSFTVGPNATSWEDSGMRYVTHWATGMNAGPADESSQTLTFVVTNNTNPSLFSVGPAASGSTGMLSYTLAPDVFGMAEITVVAQDNGGTANGGSDTSAPQVFTITVLEDVQFTTSKALTSAPANLDMPETYRLRVSVPDTPQLLPLNVELIVDTLPPGTVFNGATPAADCQPGCIGTTPAIVAWTNPCSSVMPGSHCDITVNVVFPSATFPSGTNVTNSFTGDATPLGETVLDLGVTSITHPVTTFVPGPDADVVVGLAPTTPNAPTLLQTFSYDLNVLNDGNVPLDNLVVIDTLPIELQVMSVTTGAYTGLSDFAAGEGVRVSYEKNTAPGVFTLWGSSPNTTTNTTLTAPPPGLGASEYLTRIRWEYGQAAPGMAPTSRPQISGWISTLDNAGGPVAIGDTIQNCADLSAVHTAGPTNVTRNDCYAFTIDEPNARFNPAIEILSGAGPFNVNDVVTWRLRVRSTGSSHMAPLQHIVVTDLLPEGMTFDSWTFDDQTTGLPAPQIFEQITNFAGTGRTLLRWRWSGGGFIGLNQQVFINTTTTVNGAVFGSPGTGIAPLLNTVAMSQDAVGLVLRCSGSPEADALDLDGDGNTAETFCTASATAVTFNP